jgi:Ca2+-binding RTX toxin-like protein
MAANITSDASVTPIFGTSGNDVLVGTEQHNLIFGGAGDDVLVGRNGGSLLDGGAGNDILIGRGGSDLLVGGPGQDTMTGGAGANTFLYNSDPFDGIAPAAPAAGQLLGVNAPDTITDFDVSKDTFALDVNSLGLQAFSFANGAVNDLSGDANILVLQGSFANARSAAQAIADNHALTADAGVFIYHNNTLGINRLVYSSDLSKGGAFSVLASLTSQGGDAGVALLPNYTAQNFSVI